MINLPDLFRKPEKYKHILIPFGLWVTFFMGKQTIMNYFKIIVRVMGDYSNK